MRYVYLSYSHADRPWRDAFHQMLRPGLDRVNAELWADDRIRVGNQWERAIDDAIKDAVLGLLLVTPSHLASDFVWRVEVPALLVATVPITWVLVEDCLW